MARSKASTPPDLHVHASPDAVMHGGLHDHAVPDRRADLVRARLVLWAALDGGAEQTAPLIRELRAVVAELAAMPVAAEGSKADDLRARRERRRAHDSPPATKRSQPRRSNGVHRAG